MSITKAKHRIQDSESHFIILGISFIKSYKEKCSESDRDS